MSDEQRDSETGPTRRRPSLVRFALILIVLATIAIGTGFLVGSQNIDAVNDLRDRLLGKPKLTHDECVANRSEKACAFLLSDEERADWEYEQEVRETADTKRVAEEAVAENEVREEAEAEAEYEKCMRSVSIDLGAQPIDPFETLEEYGVNSSTELPAELQEQQWAWDQQHERGKAYCREKSGYDEDDASN